MTYKIFTTEIKSKRKIMKLKQVDMANKLGISPSKYCKIENGSTEPSFIELLFICKILEISLDSIIESLQNMDNLSYD